MKSPFPRLALFLVALLVLPAVLGEALYKWVDEQGNVHYSDKPHPGATRLHLPKPTTYVAPSVAAPKTLPQESGQQQPQFSGYTRFEIASPAPDQVFWNVRSVTVTLAVKPELREGDQVTITLDDKTVGPNASLTATFSDLDRGEHSVHATLMGAGGNMVAKPVTFYIQKSIAH